jgi:hypothetical protein
VIGGLIVAGATLRASVFMRYETDSCALAFSNGMALGGSQRRQAWRFAERELPRAVMEHATNLVNARPNSERRSISARTISARSFSKPAAVSVSSSTTCSRLSEIDRATASSRHSGQGRWPRRLSLSELHAGLVDGGVEDLVVEALRGLGFEEDTSTPL